MSLLHRFIKPGRQWQQVDAKVYAQAYSRFGGSVLTHPLMVTTMSAMAAIQTNYFALQRNGELLGAIPVWDNYIAGDKRYLKKIAARAIFDTGNAEVILPLSSDQAISVKGFRGQFISAGHKDNLTPLHPQKECISLARSFQDGGFSGKFRYNRRRELKQFQQDGGEIIPFSQLSSDDICALYIKLFTLRWGKKPKGHARLHEFIAAIRPLVHGHLLSKDNIPVAIQLIFIAAGEHGISAEYINGGVDPQFKRYSPGSILSFINIQYAEQLAAEHGAALRYSFGINDNDYKNVWCDPHPLYRF